MPHWLIKSAVQRAISMLPARQKWNELFQRYVTRSLELTDSRFVYRVEHCRKHLNNFFEAQTSVPDTFTALELGTGWYPVPTFGFYLCGAEQVWTVDIDPLVSSQRLQVMLNKFLEADAKGDLKKLLPRLRPERVERLRSEAKHVLNEPVDVFLKRFNIHFMVRDAQDTGLPDRTVDLLTSTGVIEYIPPSVLYGIFKEFSRVCTDRGVMSHWINLVDQFSYFDKSITSFNYLKYSDGQWRWFNSPLIWQSRLRISDYRKLIKEAGYEILKEETTSGSMADMKRIKLAAKYERYSPEDILVLTAWIIARPSHSLGD